MSLVDAFSLKYTEDVTLFQYSNDTVYGGSNPARNAAGEYLLAMHVNEDTTEDFLLVDSTPYLTKILYDITNSIDGHYRFERLRFPLYSSGANYVSEILDSNGIISTYANLIFYSTTNKFYKCTANITNIAPDAINGNLYWQEITDFTLSSIRLNTTITSFVENTLYDARGRKCVKDELYNLSKDGCVTDVNKLFPYLKKKIYLTGARSKADDLNPEEAEVITRILQNLCPNCGC
jgi:hypothetical protein